MANPLLAPALVETILVTYRDVRAGTNQINPIPHLPMPSQYASVVIVYGALSLLPQSASRLASLIGWGFVVATALNVWAPGATIRNTNAAPAAPAPKA